MTEGTDRSPRAILNELAKSPDGDDLARLVHTLAWTAYDERRPSLEHGLDDAASRLGVDEAKAETSFGNVLRAVRKGKAASGPERTLLGALVARGVALAPPASREAEVRVAEALLWIASQTVVDPLAALEPALGQGTEPLFSAIAGLLRKYDDGAGDAPTRAAAVLGAVLLRESDSKVARAERDALRVALRDPTLVALLGAGSAAATPQGDLAFEGERTSPARGPVATLLLTLTLVLPALAAGRLFARYALRLRRPATVIVTSDGVRVRSRTELLGRILKEEDVFIARAGLSRASREVRFPRLGAYVGVGALLVGSYLGVRFLVDGARSGSPELLGLGLVVLVGALGVDYLMTLLPGRAPTRCRVVFVPRKGRTVALAGVERRTADAALHALARAAG
jgi:hypothetical protein